MVHRKIFFFKFTLSKYSIKKMFLNLLNLLKKIKLIINLKKIKVMSARIARAIIGCTRKQPKNVLDTANNVVEKMYDNNDIYTTPQYP